MRRVVWYGMVAGERGRAAGWEVRWRMRGAGMGRGMSPARVWAVFYRVLVRCTFIRNKPVCCTGAQDVTLNKDHHAFVH